VSNIPPLVEAGSQLKPAELQRYSRQLLLPSIGVIGQRRLKNARVLVLGAGGLGSPVLQYLAAAGVGTLGVLDDDVVDVSNLHRQLLHTTDAVGEQKVRSAATALRSINPLVSVVEHDERLTVDNAARLISAYHLVIDGMDTFDSRYIANDAAAAAGIPYVWGSVLGFDGQVSVFWDAAPGGGIDLRDLFPTRPDDADQDTCSSVGVLGPLCATVGGMMAAEAIKLIVGAGEVAIGRVLVADALDATWREIPLHRSAERVAERASARSAGSSATVRPVVPLRPGRAPAIAAATLPYLVEDAEAAGSVVTIVDVREDDERAALPAVDGALVLPFGAFMRGVRPEVSDHDDPIVLYCATEKRSSIAATMLRDEGWSNACYVAGGVLALI
jgi:adenylyltransferase/sulfurtransferase